jgi:hypothetical protein
MAKNREGEVALSELPGEDELLELGAEEQAGRDLGWDDEERAEEDDGEDGELMLPTPDLPDDEYMTMATPSNVYAWVHEFIVVMVDVFDDVTGEFVPTATIRTIDGDFVSHFDPRKPEEARVTEILQAEAIERALSGRDE